MKQILLIAVVFISYGIKAQAWEDLDPKSKNIGDVTSITQHNNKLYVAGFNISQTENKLWSSTDGGNNFTKIATNGLPSSFDQMLSANERLYVETWQPTKLTSLIWYTDNDGESWNLDTAGLPLAKIMYWHVYNSGKEIIMQKQGDDNYFHKSILDDSWSVVDTFHVNDRDPLNFTSTNDTLLAVTPLKLWFSNDNANSWESLGNSGLPFYYINHGLEYNRGRIFSAVKEFQTPMKLYYSDDFGSSWDTLSVAPFFGKTQFGTDQVSTLIKSVGNEVWITIQNDKANSVIDLIKSDDFGETWAYDTEGFYTDPNGTDFIDNMIVVGNEIFASSSLGKLYKKDLATSTGVNSYTSKQFNLFPNPTSNVLNIESDESLIGETINIYDNTGNQLKQIVLEKFHQTIDISDLKNGFYIVKSKNQYSNFIKQ